MSIMQCEYLRLTNFSHCFRNRYIPGQRPMAGYLGCVYVIKTLVTLSIQTRLQVGKNDALDANVFILAK